MMLKLIDFVRSPLKNFLTAFDPLNRFVETIHCNVSRQSPALHQTPLIHTIQIKLDSYAYIYYHNILLYK